MPVSVAQSDIEKEWRPLTPAEAAIVPGLSEKAWRRIVARVPAIESYILMEPDPAVSPDAVRDVMASMIVRVLKNPDGWRVDPRGDIDDYSEGGGTRDTSLSSGELYVSDAELAMLTPFIAPTYGVYVMGLGG